MTLLLGVSASKLPAAWVIPRAANRNAVALAGGDGLTSGPGGTISGESFVQARAGHAQASMTERCIHAAQVAFPGAAEKAEARLFAEVTTEGAAG